MQPQSPSHPHPPPYFTGSSRVEDYFIDLAVDHKQQPLDIQAYLECIGIELRRQASPDDPEWNGENAAMESGYEPYVPRMDVVAEGLEALREASLTKEHGVWMDPSDITPDDMAPPILGGNPWLASLVRRGALPAVHSAMDVYTTEPWSYNAVVYVRVQSKLPSNADLKGNVRIAFPTELCGPQTGCWLDGTATLYGRKHPVRLPADRPRKNEYDDGYSDDDEQDDETDEDLVVKMRYALRQAGVQHTLNPVLPLTRQTQEFFDEDPVLYHEMRGKMAMRGAPMSPLPDGFDKWFEGYKEENARRRAESRSTGWLDDPNVNPYA